MQSYIDLSKLAKPQIIEELSVDSIFAEVMVGFKAHLDDDQIFTALLASDPAVKLNEYWAYREFILRQRINDTFAQTLLAFARDAALEHMAAAWNIERGVLEYDDDGEPLTYQSNDDLRQLVQMAPEGISTAGSRMSYLFHALNLGRIAKTLEVEKTDENTITITYHLNDKDNADLKAIYDANAVCPLDENGAYMAGHVHVAALSYAENGELTEASLTALGQHLGKDFVRPLTDQVTIMQGENKDYQIVAEIEYMPGVDAALVKAEAITNLNQFVKQRYKLGEIASVAGIYDAIHTDNVRRVTLISPTTDVVTEWNQAPRCTAITLSEVGNE